jgi:hypothetical protein
MEKIIMEGPIECKKEDGGRALIAEVDRDEKLEDSDNDAFFVRIQSWSDDRTHPTMNALIGKKVRVTIEIIEE